MDDSHEKYFLLEKVALLRPATALDVGCGCGEGTVRLSPYCGQITAVDLFDALIERCKRENPRSNISYLCMDGKNLRFSDDTFEMVLERDSLHHIKEWQVVVREMIRVSAADILIEEPIDDFRNESKRATALVQDLMLEVQKEVDYPHYRHLQMADLLACLAETPVVIHHEIFRTDEPVELHEYEVPFRFFAGKSQRRTYWMDKFTALKAELSGRQLCKTDKLLIFASKRI